MMSLLRTMFHRGWRVCLGVVVIVAAAPIANAQNSLTLPGVVLDYPSTLFDGNSSSQIIYTGSLHGSRLTVNAAATQLNPKGSTDIYLIVTTFSEQPAPVNGV